MFELCISPGNSPEYVAKGGNPRKTDLNELSSKTVVTEFVLIVYIDDCFSLGNYATKESEILGRVVEQSALSELPAK